jgi:hypothetical protein
MNLGVTLKSAEKKFGPALPGPASSDRTLAAVRYAKGGAKKFAGIPGIHDQALFHIHFPTPIDWNLLTSKKGIPDFVNDLKESGPQGEQGREALVAGFLQKYESIREKEAKKREAAAKKIETAAKKAVAAQIKAQLAQQRQRLAPFVGEQEATLLIGNESIPLRFTITADKAGKIKISASL